MALRSEDLGFGPEAVVYRFPVAARRRARRRMMVRRRLTLSAVVLTVVATTLAGGGVAETAPESRSRKAVVVQPGDTLWDIATRFAPPGTDVRAYVDALIELNGLEAGLPAGIRVRLPK